MKHIPSYPSVFALGHKMIDGLFDDPVVVQEKYDGSQFSVAILDGGLCCRSKGKDLVLDAPEKMFAKAVAQVKDRQNFRPGLIYRFEYLQSPKHNTMAYSRVPAGNLVLFDIDDGLGNFVPPDAVQGEAMAMGFETAMTMYPEGGFSMEWLTNLLEMESSLGGTKIEGIVVKNYSLFTAEKKVAIGKYVSERFKEIHSADWRKRNPTGKDVVQVLIERLRTDARWQKAVQHIAERGELQGAPQDIGPLIREVQSDVLREGEDFIKDELWRHFWPQIQRGITAGLPEWYKKQLASRVLDGAADANRSD